jgi:hypothetical protein
MAEAIINRHPFVRKSPVFGQIGSKLFLLCAQSFVGFLQLQNGRLILRNYFRQPGSELGLIQKGMPIFCLD